MKVIDNLNSKELKSILKGLKTYKEMKTKLWKRGIDLFKRELNKKPYLLVEYFPSLEKKEIIEKAIIFYKKAFNIDVKKEDLILKKVKDIKWWMKIYYNDSMIDISYARIEKKLKK